MTDPDDRRKVLVEITPAAEDMLDRMLPEVQQISVAIMGKLNDSDKRKLRAILATVREALTELPDDVAEPKPRRTPPRLRRRRRKGH